MKKRRLGQTDMYVNPVGLGCMGFSHAYGKAKDKDIAIGLLRDAHKLGYDFYDTAECYTGICSDGSTSYNEELVGEAIKDFRNEVIVATKFGVKHKGSYLELDSSKDAIISAINGSLKRLNVDCIDLYYQHRIDPKVEPEAVAEVMKELIKEGKIKAWGISETNEEYLRRAHSVCKVTAIQNRYSMMARWYENLFTVCEELNISYVAFSPIANGLLSGKYTNETKFLDGDFRNNMPQYSESGYEKAKDLLKLLEEISKEKNSTMAQISLAWMMGKNKNIIPIPGSTNLSRLKENFDSSSIELSKEEIKKIDCLLEKMSFEVFGGNK